MQALTAAGQVVGRERLTVIHEQGNAPETSRVRRAGSWTEPHLGAGRREVVRCDAPRNVGRGKEPVGM